MNLVSICITDYANLAGLYPTLREALSTFSKSKYPIDLSTLHTLLIDALVVQEDFNDDLADALKTFGFPGRDSIWPFCCLHEFGGIVISTKNRQGGRTKEGIPLLDVDLDHVELQRRKLIPKEKIGASVSKTIRFRESGQLMPSGNFTIFFNLFCCSGEEKNKINK